MKRWAGGAEFADLSTILGADRERLSKRHGATSIANFREMESCPSLDERSRVATGPGTERVHLRNLGRAEARVHAEAGHPVAGGFDMEKLDRLNRHYIKQSPPDHIEKLAEPGVPARIAADSGQDKGRNCSAKVRGRCSRPRSTSWNSYLIVQP